MKIIKLFGKKWVIMRTDDPMLRDIRKRLIDAEAGMFVVEHNIEWAINKRLLMHLTKWDIDCLKESQQSLKELHDRMIKLGLY